MVTTSLTLVTQKTKGGSLKAGPQGPVFMLSHFVVIFHQLYRTLFPLGGRGLCTRDTDGGLPGPAHFRSAGGSLSQVAKRRQDKRDFSVRVQPRTSRVALIRAVCAIHRQRDGSRRAGVPLEADKKHFSRAGSSGTTSELFLLSH